MDSYDKELYLILGSRLRQIRNEKKLSLEYVANKINMTKKTIQRYEVGAQRVPVDKLIAMCNLYNYSIDELNNEVKSLLNNQHNTLSLAPWIGNIINQNNPNLIKLLSKISKMSDDQISILDSVADGLINKKRD